ncbi:MAGUK p55 subfamily member 7 isoform X3 [Silurus meridionalis]|nr:MAGUK p55 subfamily member 7 isoform X3 [Silurus meridionalis]
MDRFIEYGRHAGNYYGTGLGSVRRVLAEGKAAKLLYTAEFKPYVAFVRPPAIEQLRFSRRKAKILAGCEEPVPSRTFMEADFEEMINATKEMENEYAYLFEKIAINDDLARVFTEIRAELRKLEKESNWIPKIWAEKL